MNTTINLNNYPIFTPNQVLTDADLNGVVNYLEGLNQLTRTHFVGMGIAYGLEVQHLNNPTRIQITPGCGITSEGFVIQMTAETLTDAKNTFTHYQDATIAKNLFIPGASSQQSYMLKELVPMAIGQKGGTNLHPLTEEVLKDQVVVVLYDWQDLPRPENCQLNYDEQSGKERSFRLRFFLLPGKQPEGDESTLSAESLLRVGYQMGQLPEPWKTFDTQLGTAAVFEARNQFLKVKDLALQIRRFGYVDAEKSVDLTKINDYESLRENYFQICGTAIAAINTAFPELFRLFSPFFTAFHPNSKQDFANLAQPLNNLLQRFHPNRPLGAAANTTEPPYTLQYFYDYLSQLVAAYAELVEVVFDLMDDCTPDMGRFPCFLMLGLVPPFNQFYKGYEVPSAYRSQFIQPRIYNNNQTRIQQVRYLYDRLLNLCNFEAGKESFYLLPFYKTPIKITPSKDRSVPLSEQAIPYYLNYPKLYPLWNYDAYRKGRIDRHPAYFYPKQQGDTTPHVFDDLTYRLDAYNFYRIEGHVGQSNTDALKSIQDYQKRYNLSFDVITLKLGKAESLKDLNISAQLEHLSESFAQLKDRFQARWKANAEEWSNNVLITTLKQVFFDQPSLEDVNSDLLFNRFLDSAEELEHYEFVAQKDAANRLTGKYQLFLKNAAGTRIARYLFRDRNSNPFELLNFTGMTDDAIVQEQKRILSGLVDALAPNKITYAIERQSPSLLRFYLRFLSKDPLTVPLDRAGTPSQEAVTIELKSLDTFSIQETPELKIEEPGCPDVMTLCGLLRDLPEGDNSDLKFKLGNPSAAQEIGSAELTRLIEAYQQRLEQLISLQLFHRFAQQHPGMEPLGGVPKGGTFILVYVDGQDVASLLADEQNRAIYDFRISRSETIEAAAWLPAALSDQAPPQNWEALLQEVREREDIVVADFCLPYRSNNDAPAVSYVLARPRPIVLLQKMFFCEGDSTSYPFILEPEGGSVKGEGVRFDGQQHVFQPSSISQSSHDALANGNEVAITFSYAVDDTYDTLTVTIHPNPKPALTIQQGQRFCRDASPVEIGLAVGTPTNLELVQVTINGTETTTFSPSQYAADGESQTIEIAAQIRDQQTQCENTLQYTVTVNALPNAEFRIGEPDKTSFLTSDAAVTLTPTQSGGVFQARVGEQDISNTVLEGNEFSPGRVRFSELENEKTVALKYSISQDGCSNESTRNVTIFVRPAIDALKLFMNGSRQVQLQDEQTFPLSFFSPNCHFESQVTGKVNSVVFTYTSPDESEEVMAPVNTAPYRMPRNWQPSVGTHVITAQPYSENDGEGVEGELKSFKITITDDGGEAPQIAPSPTDQGTLPQPDSPPNALGMTPFLARLPQTSGLTFDALSSHSSHPSSSISNPAGNTLLPPTEPSTGTPPPAPINATPSHPDPVSPWSAELEPPQPRNGVQPKLVQALVLGAIAALLSLIWVYSTTKSPRTPQPTSSSSTTDSPFPNSSPTRL